MFLFVMSIGVRSLLLGGCLSLVSSRPGKLGIIFVQKEHGFKVGACRVFLRTKYLWLLTSSSAFGVAG